MENLTIFQVSQSHLQVLETCPRKFQHLFLESLMLPLPSTEQQELGSQFHQLMQQRSLGLDIQPMLADNPQLKVWFQALETNPPPLIPGLFRQSEYQCTLAFEDFVLIAVCDLLIHDGSSAQIVDWKTYRRPPQTRPLQQHWQTRLYLYVIAEHFGYAPEQVSMLYWFAESAQSATDNPMEPWLKIHYSEAEHHQTHQDLHQGLKHLRQWIEDFSAGRSSFPQVPLSAGRCFSPTQPCPFTSHCYRDDTAPALAQLMDLTAIAEVPLHLSSF